MPVTGAQLRGARGLLGISREELAKRAGVSFETVKRIEGQSLVSANVQTVDAIRRAFSEAGVIFIDENGDGPGVRLRKDR